MEITFPLSEFHLGFHYIPQIKSANDASAAITVKFIRGALKAESAHFKGKYNLYIYLFVAHSQCILTSTRHWLQPSEVVVCQILRIISHYFVYEVKLQGLLRTCLQ